MNDESKAFPLPVENKERVISMTQNVFTPSLQKAVEEVQGQAPFMEILSAASSAFGDMLDKTVGPETAASILKSLATHLENRKSTN